ncbi:MAG: hypothetical protein IT342_09125 [Candidatus Melainabacteria bacterium]|nr:hypothetical protein [Candidatus Melainabacteria bacterium]
MSGQNLGPNSPNKSGLGTGLNLEVDQLIVSLKKRILIPGLIVVGVLIWFSLCRAFYESYWSGTVHRVQTVDFNILHHTLPSTLSQLIVSGRDDQIQNVLDSTYGLFGLVVTDPTGNSILYQTDKVYRRKSWQKRLSPENLKTETEPFDLLTDPPPVSAAFQHLSPRSAGAVKVEGETQPGRVLGRVYYMRSYPPTLMEDLNNFLTTGFWELSGSKRGYLFITLASIFFCLVVVLLIWLRRRGIELKEKELEHIQKELEIRQRALAHLSGELANQKTRKAWLEKEAEHSYKRALVLKQSLERLRDSLALVSGQQAAPPPAQALDPQQLLKVRPPVHPPSALLEEIEMLIPALSDNAKALRSQAGLLQDYCQILENRQVEMHQLVENAYTRAQQVSDRFIDMRPGSTVNK